MKSAGAATLAILASGQYLKVEAYSFLLPKVSATPFYFVNWDTPLTLNSLYGQTGLTIVRSAFTQKLGLQVQSVDLTIEADASVLIGGVGFLNACASGLFDGGTVAIYKGFFNAPATQGAKLDVSPGFVPWFTGQVDEVQVGRFSVDITVNDIIQILNVQMPRNILQAGCVHTLFDAGCTLAKSAYLTSGSVTSIAGVAAINCGLSQASGYFSLGILTFTSGVLSGSAYSIKTYIPGQIQTIIPFATAPSVGDTFTVVPGCDKSQATCTSKFSNLAHYRGAPYVPQPETLYDGGTPATTAPSIGGQGGQGAGSPFSGIRGAKTYVK